jgi:16S rRNA (adenine1518-N6/adenine1519-N6)-dimethyltransferase
MIADLVEGGLRPEVMVFTVQRELADRMCSQPGAKSYSSFSVLCQSCFQVSGRGDLKPGSFYPIPEVVSTIVEMRPRREAPKGRTLALLSELARGLFASRRKTIRNNISSQRIAAQASVEDMLAALQKVGVDPGRRAEELPPDVFVQLARDLASS